VQPDANVSAARAAAINAVSAALQDVEAYGTAATVALDRYGGASEAHNLIWAAQQAQARLHYEQQMGSALLAYADALEAFVQVLIDEGETEIDITPGEVASYQQRMATQGYTAEEIALAHQMGWTDAQLEARRQAIVAADPNDLVGSRLDKYTDEAAFSRELGLALLESNSYAPRLSVGGSPGFAEGSGSGNSLAQIANTTATFPLGNPLTQTAVIDLRARRVDLPADWMVSVSPAQVTLAPGEQITVTVNVLSGSPVPQGALPRVAVEAYAGSALLGGVTFEIVVPAYVVPIGINDLYLPLVSR
jgi:hypothetical protein